MFILFVLNILICSALARITWISDRVRASVLFCVIGTQRIAVGRGDLRTRKRGRE